MKLTLKENKKNRIVFDVDGEGHSLCNALSKELWNSSEVKTAGYYVEHPDLGLSTLVVETKGSKDAKTEILEAAKRLKKQNDVCLKAFLKVLK